MSAERVLLLLDPQHPAPEATARAVEAARGGALFALAVLDRELLRPLRGKLGEVGLLGEEQTRGIVDALAQDHRERAAERLAEVGEAAERAQVPFDGALREGELVETCLAEIRARRAERVVVPGRRRSRLARLLGETRLDALEARANCAFEYVGD
jgi:nucleotide-binding universal stress UspA family protein